MKMLKKALVFRQEKNEITRSMLRSHIPQVKNILHATRISLLIIPASPNNHPGVPTALRDDDQFLGNIL